MERTLELLNKPWTGNLKSTLYIHIPFCDQVCSFCGFNKSVSPEDLKAQYVDALIAEMHLYSKLANVQSMQVGAVYLGGGTPNSLSAEQLDRILSNLHKLFPLDKDVEITCEGVIQNFTPERIAALKKNGVERVSAGIQTFDGPIRAEHLHMRLDKQDLLDGIANLKANFNNFNLDFIYNLPNQTDEIWAEDVELALKSGATHLTFYPLVLLENTAFYSDYVKTKKHEAPDQDREIKMFEYTLSKIRNSPYTNQYSVRDWALPGFDCRYIRMNAESNNIIALGAGAHGYLGGMTYKTIRNTKQYINTVLEKKQLPLEGQKFSTNDELMQRYMVMGLRLKHLNMKPFKERFGVSFSDVYADKMEAMVHSGYIKVKGHELEFTHQGDIWANNVRTYFEGVKASKVGYTDTTSIGEDGKTHYAKITRIKAAGDVEANV